MAVGVIDMAIWDLVAKIEEKPLYKLLAEKYRGEGPDNKTFVYAAGGYYYPGKPLEELKHGMASYLEQGYRVVKMKIGSASLKGDIERIDAVSVPTFTDKGWSKNGITDRAFVSPPFNNR